MRQFIGIALIACSLLLGYQGVKKISNNNTSVEILEFEIDLSNKAGKEDGYLFVGCAVLLLAGGVYLLKK